MSILTQSATTGPGNRTELWRHAVVQLWLGAGLTLVALHLGLAWISPQFSIETDLAEKPVVTLVALKLAAGAIFLFMIRRGLFARTQPHWSFAWIVLVGLILRGTMICSSPILETDFFRYLWDGAILANGMNPYKHAPDEALRRSERVPDEAIRLADGSGEVIHRINYSYLRTIYPPVAQIAFAAAYFIKPWSLLAWRAILALFDAATAILLLIALRDLDIPRQWLAVYWWNPLVVLEVFNAGHMDVLTLPFALGGVLVAVKGRAMWAGVLLALGTGAKLWPVVLLPLVLATLRKTPGRLTLCLALFSLVCGLLAIPVYLGGFDGTSGFVAYGREWEMNDALYMLLWWVAAYALKILSLHQAEIHLVARVLSMTIFGCLLVYCCRKVHEASHVWESSLIVVAALFMLSPAQFPWYYLWVIPFLVIRPRLSLLLLGVLLPIYYLRFYFKARGNPGIFDNYVVWLEYVPVWTLFLMEGISSRGKTADGKLFVDRHPPEPPS